MIEHQPGRGLLHPIPAAIGDPGMSAGTRSLGLRPAFGPPASAGELLVEPDDPRGQLRTGRRTQHGAVRHRQGGGHPPVDPSRGTGGGTHHRSLSGSEAHVPTP